jgi:outer membrane protein TolC
MTNEMIPSGPTIPLHHRYALRVPLLLCCVILLALPGCQVDEKKEVALYRSVLDGEKPIQVEYQPGEPLSLPQALLLANQGNERLALQGENYVQALIDKERAASAFFPTITLVPSYSDAQKTSDASGQFVTGGGAVDQNSQRGSALATGGSHFDTPVNLNVNAFRGFRDVANVGRSEAEIRRNRSLLLDLQATVLLDVVRAYYLVLRAERAVQVLETSAATQEQRVQEMRTRDVVGAAQKLDVAQIEAQAAATRAGLVTARNQVRNDRIMLAFLVDAKVVDAPLVDRLDVPAAVASPDVFLALAQASRQDLRAAEQQIEAARQNVQIAFGQYYPSISVNVNYYLQRQSPPSDSDWNALISANLPIFTGGRINADYRQSLSQLRQAKLQESLLRRQIEQDVLTSYENLAASTHRLQELRIETDAAQTAYDVAVGRYRAGLGTYLDQLIAQDRLLSAQLDFATEEYDRKLFYLDLLRIAGQLTNPADPIALQPLPIVTARGAAGPTTAPTEPAGMAPSKTQPVTAPVLPATAPGALAPAPTSQPAPAPNSTP